MKRKGDEKVPPFPLYQHIQEMIDVGEMPPCSECGQPFRSWKDVVVLFENEPYPPTISYQHATKITKRLTCKDYQKGMRT